MIKMKINIKTRNPGGNATLLKADQILRYLISEDDEMDRMIMCKPPESELAAYDNEIYGALASVRSYDNIDINRLKKFFEVVNVCSYKEETGNDKPIIKEDKVDKIRASALKKESS